MTDVTRDLCRACGTKLPGPFLDLGDQPLANNLADTREAARTAPHFPLRLCKCPLCHLVQLDFDVPATDLFSHYLYTPDSSASFRRHLEGLADTLNSVTSNGSGRRRALDIGSNSGLLLRRLMHHGWEVRGVEPAQNLAMQANAAGVPTMTAFWGDSGVVDLVGRESYDVVTATNVFAHVTDPIGFARAVREVLKPDGVFVIECPSLAVMLRDGTWDLTYHEHRSYFSAISIGYVLTAAGLDVVRIEDVAAHGGSLRVWAQRPGARRWLEGDAGRAAIKAEIEAGLARPEVYGKFGYDAIGTAAAFYKAVRRYQGRVIGYGAPAKATTLITLAGLEAADIAFIVDDNPLKQYRFIPGAAIQVVPPTELARAAGYATIVFPWNLAKTDILPRLTGNGDVIIPMPRLEVIHFGHEGQATTEAV